MNENKKIIDILKSRGILGSNAGDNIPIETIKRSINEKWDDIRENYTVDTFFSDDIKLAGIENKQPSRMTKDRGCGFMNKYCMDIKKYIKDKFANQSQEGGKKRGKKTKKSNKKGKKKTMKKKGKKKTKKSAKKGKKKTMKKKGKKSRK
jgi:hypothetical protein